MNTEKRGISLIVLIITIVVIVILATAVIVTIVKNNPIKEAKNSIEQHNFTVAKEKLVILFGEYLVKSQTTKISFENYFENLKVENEIDEITNNEDGTYYIELNGYEFLVKESTLEILEGSKIQGARIEVKHEFTNNITSGIIKLLVSTQDEQGIKSIIKPDGSTSVYENKEKSIELEYEIKENNRYIFKVEANSGRIKVYTVDVKELALFDVDYINGVDNQSIEAVYATSKKIQNEEQQNILSEMNKKELKDTMIYSTKNATSNSWSVIGQSKNELLSEYYVYDRYSVITTNKYVQTYDWKVTNSNYTIPYNTNLKGYLNYSFSPTEGFVVSNYRESISEILYQFRNNSLIRYIRLNSAGDTQKYHFEVSQLRQTLETVESKGGYLDQILAGENTYPIDGSYNGIWYTRKNRVNKYYIYKYIDKDIKSVYDPVSKTIVTKLITLPTQTDNVKIKVEANNTNYNIYVSNDNINWTKIEDKSKLNGQDSISLPSKYDKISIKVEANDSTISRLIIKDL